MKKFQLFTDSCSDLGTAIRKKYGIEYCRMNIVLDGEEKPADLDWQSYSYEEFYGWMFAGRKIKTTQVPVTEFVAQFRPFLEKGLDIFYVGCGSKLSGSINVFALAKEQLLEEFPDRKILAIDSLSATGGEYLMAIKAAEMMNEGKDAQEVADFLDKDKVNYQYVATVDDLKYLKNAGRIKGAKAFFGNIMGVKPILISGLDGNNIALKNARGTKASIEEIFNYLKENKNENTTKVLIGQAKAEASAAKLKERITTELGLPVEEFIIGPIIGTSCGPGVLMVAFYGKPKTAVIETEK